MVKHFVVFPYAGWGHTRPVVYLVARFVQMRPDLRVTFCTFDSLLAHVNAEIERNFEPSEKQYAEHIRVISMGSAIFLRSDEADNNFKHTWGKLVSGGPATCFKTGKAYDALPRPSAVLTDLFATKPFGDIKAISGDSIKVYMWHPGLSYDLFYLWGSEKVGGKGNFRLKAEEEAHRTGQPYEEIVSKLAWGPQGKLVQIPAFPPLYDHEYFPQDLPMSDDIKLGLIPHMNEYVEATDGVFLCSPDCIEPGAKAAIREWFAEKSRPVFVCWSIPPSSSFALSEEMKQTTDIQQIEALLESTLRISGEKSLVYVSMGSMFWPAACPEKMWTLLDVLMEMNVPFILSHASPMAVVPDQVREKVKAYGKGLLSPWTPQQMILNHPATGWIVTHGGHGGVMESLCAGVPMIFWPFVGDQPLNAIHFSDSLKVSYELTEVRSGAGLGPIHRNGKTPTGTVEAVAAEVRDILLQAFGEDGAKKRQRLLEVREQVMQEGSWADGGVAQKDMNTFLDSLREVA
ncbi:UDP-Glycosyltransferase/glycogen phosphorylase [Cubamyces lactineus]|nr:UDP-Glycosyltransferase/glycogen phosphorylase [Cubamyces lactineus]